MSLILTTNTSVSESGEGSLTTGINLPYDYRNFTTDTYEIDEDSEIAVQSVKFNKEGNIEVNRSNNQFYMYMGDNSAGAQGAANRVTSACIHTNIGDVGDKFVAYNIETLPKAIEVAIDGGLAHPDMVKNDTTNLKGTNASINRDSENKFAGYNIQINYGSASGISNKLSDLSFVDSINLNTVLNQTPPFNGSFLQGAAPRITKMAGQDCEMINTGAPITLCHGQFGGDFTNAGGNWHCGLTRYLDEFAPHHAAQNIGYFHPAGATYYDYVVKSVLDVSTAKYYLRVYHSVTDNEDEQLELVEIDYSHVVGLIEVFTDPADYTATKICKLIWVTDNEQIRLDVISTNGAVSHTLFDGKNADRKKNLKPINQNCKYLYPKVRVADDAKYMVLTHWYQAKPVGFVYGNNRSVGDGTLQGNPQNFDWFCKCYHESEIDLCKTIDNRYMINYEDFTGDNATYTQFGLNGSGSFYFPIGNASNYSVALVLTEDDTADANNNAIGYVPSIGANAADILGFNDDPIANVPNASTTVSQNFQSMNVPTMTSTNSIFVRLNNFTQRSINGQTNGTSKIVYHIPRFDNSGSEFGGLFFEPNQRTYLSLGNTNKMRIQDFHLSLVNSDETLATNITGKTIIMLHIRKK